MPPDVALVGAYPSGAGSDTSGVASYTAKLASALADTGMAVAVVAPSAPGAPPAEADGRIRVERPFSSGWWAWPAAARAASATGAPVIHLQHEHFLFGGPLTVPGIAPALALLRTGRQGVVATLHQVVDPAVVDRQFVSLHRMPIPAWAARAGLAGVQKLVAAATDVAIVHEDAFAPLVPGSVVVHHGIDEVTLPDRVAARAELGVAGDSLVVLCFGFVAPYKGLDIALEAAKSARRDVLLVIAGGEHPRFDGETTYGDELRRRWPGVARYTGYLSEDDVARWHVAADVALLVYPRPHASSGALATAAAYGTPVLVGEPLAARAGLPAEATVPLDPGAIARRLDELAASPEGLRRLAAVTSRLVADRTWKAVADRHIALYEETLDARRRRRRNIRNR